MSKPIVLTVNEWNPNSIKFMAPKINKSGGKSISIISTQTNRTLHISTPLMNTWGIADFIDEEGNSDGKFNISLSFPNEEYMNDGLRDFVNKIKQFENALIDEGVKNSLLWFGEENERSYIAKTYYSMLKYPKIKGPDGKPTKKPDVSKPPTIRAKVSNYDDKWGVEIYDTKSNMIFPCETNKLLTPVDFVPRMSSVACVLQCGGIWAASNSWGVTFKLIQCIVKPKEIVSVYGKCQIKLTEEEIGVMEKQDIKDDVDENEEEKPNVPKTQVEDSDNEEEPEKKVEVEEKPEKKVEVEEKQVEPEPEVIKEVVKPVLKKTIVKKPVDEQLKEEAPQASTVVKKKIIKKAA
jgi:hypothetical protein